MCLCTTQCLCVPPVVLAAYLPALGPVMGRQGGEKELQVPPTTVEGVQSNGAHAESCDGEKSLVFSPSPYLLVKRLPLPRPPPAPPGKEGGTDQKIQTPGNPKIQMSRGTQ